MEKLEVLVNLVLMTVVATSGKCFKVKMATYVSATDARYKGGMENLWLMLPVCSSVIFLKMTVFLQSPIFSCACIPDF